MREHEMLLLCLSEFTEAEASHHLDMVEARLQTLLEEKKMKKRIFFVVMECIQNITRHGMKGVGKSVPCLFALGRDSDSLYVLTSNLVEKEKVDALGMRIDQVNAIPKRELRDVYRKTLQKGEFNEAGGANLGLVEIARKAEGKLEYHFEEHDEHSAYFTLKVNLMKTD